MRKSSATKDVAAFIEREIRSRPIGARLLSFRDLMDRFGCSQATVDNALARFEKSGMIVRRQGAGLFVGESAGLIKSMPRDTVVFAVPDMATRACALMVTGAEEAAREKGLRLEVRNYGPDPSTAFASLPGNVAGVVMVPRGIDIDNGSASAALAALPADMPSVLAENDLPGRRGPAVCMDDFEAGSAAARLFQERGVRRIACLGSSTAHTAQRRLSGLTSLAGEALALIIDFPSARMFDREALRRLPEASIDGLFIARPDIALQALCYIEALRIRVPGDLSVVTIAEQDDEQAYPFRVAALVKPTVDMGREAVRALGQGPEASRSLPYRVSIETAVNAAG
jgi:GntR family transcriptional regulator, arabinose operon transcriptional repressor